MNILEKIAFRTRERVDEEKKKIPPEKIKEEALNLCTAANSAEAFKLEKVLKNAKTSGKTAFICEVKKASPSKGLIDKNFDYIKIAKEYQNAGADAISVLTEPYFFQGSDTYLQKISQCTQIPLLKKDFTIDEYQIYVAKLKGASAVLLIASLLDTPIISKYIKVADSLGLCSLVEVHDESEAQNAIEAGARIFGINNRNLKTFEVDLNTTLRLAKCLPDNAIIVSESGIKTHSDIAKLQEHGISGVLIGETLMKSDDKAKTLQNLRGEI